MITTVQNKFMKTIGMVLLLFPLLGNSQNYLQPSNQDTAKYVLVWHDEFEKEGMPDTSKWKFEQGFVRNHEDQWYQPENATCANGNLIITGKREGKPNPNFVAGSGN